MYKKVNKISPANNTSVSNSKFNFDDIYDIEVYKEQIKIKDKLIKEKDELIKKLIISQRIN